MPGDEIIPEEACQTTHAVTVGAAPQDVWPWLVQMGYGRAGWYSPAWVDRLRGGHHPSADEILPEFQLLGEGDVILDGPAGSAPFTVASLDPCRSLVLRSRRHSISGVSPDPSSRRPHLDVSWSFRLTPLGRDRTRLALRTRSVASPTWSALRSALVPADFLVGRWLLQGVKRRAETGPLRRRPTPRSRSMILDASRATRRYSATGFFECDITEARRLLASHRDEKLQKLSLTAFVCCAFARAVAAEPLANSLRDLRGRLVTFGDVDLMVMIESQVDAQSAPIGRIIRAANRKSVEQIHAELRGAQATPLAGDVGWMLRVGRWIPTPLRRAGLRWIDRNPRLAKRFKGTVSVSSVGMFAQGGGWGLSALHHTAGVIVGGITTRLLEIGGHLQTREFLSITFSVDHDIIDGGPAARLAGVMRQIIENPDAAMISGPVEMLSR